MASAEVVINCLEIIAFGIPGSWIVGSGEGFRDFEYNLWLENCLNKNHRSVEMLGTKWAPGPTSYIWSLNPNKWPLYILYIGNWGYEPYKWSYFTLLMTYFGPTLFFCWSFSAERLQIPLEHITPSDGKGISHLYIGTKILKDYHGNLRVTPNPPPMPTPPRK